MLNQEYTEDRVIELKKLTGRQRIYEAFWLIIALFTVYLAIALFSFDAADPGWSQTAWHEPIHNSAGKLGAWLADLLFFIFGVIAYAIPFATLLFCWKSLRQHKQDLHVDYFTLSLRVIGFFVLVLSSCALAAMNFDDLGRFASGGIIGDLLSHVMVDMFNYLGATLGFIFIWAIGFTLLTGWSWLTICEKIGWLILSLLTFVTNGLRANKSTKNQQASYCPRELTIEEEQLSFDLHLEQAAQSVDPLLVAQQMKTVQQIKSGLNQPDPSVVTLSTADINVQKVTSNEFTKIEPAASLCAVSPKAPTTSINVEQPVVVSDEPLTQQNKPTIVIRQGNTVTELGQPQFNRSLLGSSSLQPSDTSISSDTEQSAFISKSPQSTPCIEVEQSANGELGSKQSQSNLAKDAINNHSTFSVGGTVNIGDKILAKTRDVPELPRPNPVRIPTKRELAAYGIRLPSQRIAEQQAKQEKEHRQGQVSIDQQGHDQQGHDQQGHDQQGHDQQRLVSIDELNCDINEDEIFLSSKPENAGDFDQPDTLTSDIHSAADDTQLQVALREEFLRLEAERYGKKVYLSAMDDELTLPNKHQPTVKVSSKKVSNITDGYVPSLLREDQPQSLTKHHSIPAVLVEKSMLTATSIVANDQLWDSPQDDMVKNTENSLTHREVKNTGTNEKQIVKQIAEEIALKPHRDDNIEITQEIDIKHFSSIHDEKQASEYNIEKTRPTIKVVAEKPLATNRQVESDNNDLPSDEMDMDSLIHPFLQRNDIPLERPTTPLPTLDLLTSPPSSLEPIDVTALEEMARLVEERLADYRVKANVVEILPGPVITRFELDLAPGVKAARISNLSRDLARSLSTEAVRVVEVIPGRPYVGLELPNIKRQTVYLREVLDCDKFRNIASPLAIVLGKDIAGEPVVADLSKMPHVLVAGTTGSGKSVGINAMIISMLYKATPDEVRFIMIDPKMLELSVYEGIPHLLTEVVTDMKDASNALRWCVNEMERRYRLMSALGVRNLAGYNEKVRLAAEMGRPIPDPLWKPSESMEANMPMLEKLPYIVVIVDEFADLMMAVGKKVEELIARLAQKARAAGIHLVLATQRPSVDVITGLIKANIPTRIAFTVSSRIDSRTILDQSGAESLLGMGDMLYLPPNSSMPERVHGAFVRDEEVHAVVLDWKARGKPQYVDGIVSSNDEGDGSFNLDADEELDALFDQAVAFVIEKRRPSISGIQRQFRIGYNRAARIVEQMEVQGIVSAPANNGNREVLAPPPHE